MGFIRRIEFNDEAVTRLLKDSKVRADLVRRAQAIASAAGPGHVVVVDDTARRARVVVITSTLEARKNEATRRTLTRAIDRGRG